MAIRAIFQDTSMQIPSAVLDKDYLQILQRGTGCLWVDIQAEAREMVEPILRESFGFHPLAIEDALHQAHIPKIDTWDDYLYIVLHAVEPQSDANIADTLEIDVFVGEHYLVTFQSTPSGTIDRVWETAAQSRSILSKGSAHILYQIIDEAEAGFVPLFDGIDEQIARIEDEVFKNPSQELLAEIFSLKRSILGLRRIMAPQREVVGKLARGGYEQFSPEEKMYFHDVYDHMIQLGDMLENLRDIVNGALEIHLSAVSNRLNDVLKTLTVITTLFMPLTFIAGFFGMNFFQATESLGPWTGRTAFTIAVALMVVTPMAMYLWIRRRAWI